MSQDYYMSVPESLAISVGFGSFQEKMNEKTGNVASRIADLCALGSFTGLGAEAIKAYFAEVHLPLLQLFKDAIYELDKEYNLSFHTAFMEAAGDNAGKFPSTGMRALERDFSSVLDEAAELRLMIRRAESATPSGCGFTKPNIDQFTNALAEKVEETKRVRADVGEADSIGVRSIIESKALLADLLSALNKALSFCTSGAVAMAGYQPGAFRSLTEELRLHDLHAAVEGDVTQNHGALLAVKQQVIEDRAVYLEDEKRAAAEEKQRWAKWGTVLQYVAVGAAIAGTVAAFASGGTLLIAFSLVAVSSQAYGLGQRHAQLDAMKKDAGADLQVDPLGTALKGAKDVKGPLTSWSKLSRNSGYYDRVHDASSGLAGRITEDTFNVGAHFVSDTLIDAGADYIDDHCADNFEGDSQRNFEVGMKLGKKGLSKVVDESIDKTLETLPGAANPMKGVSGVAGAVGFFMETGQVITDHYVSENDKVIEVCDVGLEELEAYREALYEGSDYVWDAEW